MVNQKWDGKTYEEPSNLVKLYENSLQKYGNNRVLGLKDEKGNYFWVSYQEWGQRVDRVRAGFLHLGLSQKEMVGFIGYNSAEWSSSAFAY